ncbi:hypothetical protein M1P56_35210 (plasmid) [Streptomyces sp. HU2014]|uniref:hypothetical protein n=1 Tax=Streptomyces sp. HU2014 TaxID=2939414 RepID=UPI00200C21FE|nr:hypothetical protein [Streptomyces sp. HU2014]UQI49763.1 hypothetical protein M1P56_35210 [Streptomyces sp. HU2014]
MASNAKLQVRTVVHLADCGPDADPVPEVSAKQHLMQAAEGDKDAAQRAWSEVGLPEDGSVTARRLASAFALLPDGEAT